jgi:hypothetical protein
MVVALAQFNRNRILTYSAACQSEESARLDPCQNSNRRMCGCGEHELKSCDWKIRIDLINFLDGTSRRNSMSKE